MNLSQIPVLILAGGKGTRIKHLLNDLPKPMFPVLGKPFLNYVINYLQGFGFKQFIISTGYKGEIIQKKFAANSNITFIHETEALGTGGAIINALPYINADNFLVLNGDTLFLMDYNLMLNFCTNKINYTSIALKVNTETGRYGNVNINAENKIISFAEKDANSTTNLINAGIYLFNKNQIQQLALPKINSVETDVFPLLIQQGLYGFITEANFIDIGTPETLFMIENFVVKNNLKA